ncbi:DUF1638 domain-containing protein [Bengtsoniella intestinalis]|uniref:DUF1638 domain-containing protein n=1 Tax=Bengtsoniella intestinalis TaxID=3073143 RepID=UPI00391FAD74
MTHLIACSMLERELIPYLPPDVSVTWIERGLHERPTQLCQVLQETLDALPPEVDTVLLAYGFCGGAMEGISCPSATLVLPLFDDCIGMLLQGERKTRSMYFTASWLEDAQFIGNAYDRAVDDYGQEMADEIYQTMVGAYQSVVLLDTQCFDVESASQTMGVCAEKLGLALERVTGTTHRLQDLLQGGNTPEFWQLKPNERFTLIEFLERKRMQS